MTSFSQDSRATSRPHTRPGVAAAPDTDAEVFADVSSRTYSAYAAGNDRARGPTTWPGRLSLLGSKSAESRVAARRRASGREEGLNDAVVEVENGSGAGSGHARDSVTKFLGAGMWKFGSWMSPAPRRRLLMGRSALVRNSLTDFV